MNGLLQVSKRFLDKNASTILTCLGGVGVVATAVITAKAAQKALSLIDNLTRQTEDIFSAAVLFFSYEIKSFIS